MFNNSALRAVLSTDVRPRQLSTLLRSPPQAHITAASLAAARRGTRRSQTRPCWGQNPKGSLQPGGNLCQLPSSMPSLPESSISPNHRGQQCRVTKVRHGDGAWTPTAGARTGQSRRQRKAGPKPARVHLCLRQQHHRAGRGHTKLL